MEQSPQPHQPEDGEDPAPIERLSDQQRIQRGIADALNEDRPIDDATARRIASQLHGGQTSALYSLASAGALPDGLDRELHATAAELPPEQESWIDSLAAYIEARDGDRRPRIGWAALTADDPDAAIKAARAAASRERRANRALFEHYVALGIDPGDAETAIEYQQHWRDQQTGGDGEPERRPPELSGPVLGSTAELPSPEPASQTETKPTIQPRVFVIDASEGLPEDDAVRGVWLNAAVEAETLEQAVHDLLRDTPASGARAYRLAAASGFEGFDITAEESLATVARIARGVAEHGRAFLAYIEAWSSSQEAVDEFSRYYKGTWPSVAAWAEATVEEQGWNEQLDQAVPAEIRSFLRIDFDRLGRELTYDAYVIEDELYRQIYVFRLYA